MIARITPRPLRGEIAAIPSKSEAHRALICAALSDAPTLLRMGPGSEDIEATVRCLRAFGAKIENAADGPLVHPVNFEALPTSCEADCGESGSTLRFLLPVAAALGIDTSFRMHGRLPDRPIFPLDRELIRGDCEITHPQHDVLRIRGKLQPGNYELPGNVSSQYISGMLFALALLKETSSLSVTGNRESAGYIEMTLQSMAAFGAAPETTACGFILPGGRRYASPGSIAVGGDWSNAAFWLCAGAIPGCDVRVTGLDASSAQGDRRIIQELDRLCTAEGGCAVIDAADIPDLVPILAACACARRQNLKVIRAERLRIKESDRLRSVTRTLNLLGGGASETEDGLIIDAGLPLRGGEVDSCGDHRIAMMAAIASAACTEEVIIHGAEAVNKSYPGFWKDFASLGGCMELKGDA